jgi:hypothetical protein
MDHHHIAVNIISDMISNMNGDILFADHYHGSAYFTTPQMHHVSSNGRTFLIQSMSLCVLII